MGTSAPPPPPMGTSAPPPSTTSSPSTAPTPRRPPGLVSISSAPPNVESELRSQREAYQKLISEPPKDKGSAFLQEAIRDRPNGINDAPLHPYSGTSSEYQLNCSLCTVGGLTNRTSSEVAVSLGAKPSAQAMTVWADPTQNPDNTTAAFDFSAQLGGMKSSLQSYASGSGGKLELVDGTRLTDNPDVPGGKEANPMPKDELMRKMQELPNGTRFAVNVFGVKNNDTHWVTAEKFNDKLIFHDFQQNLQQPVFKRGRPSGENFIDPQRVTIDKMPLGPADGADIYTRGMFFALKPTDTVTA
jgi:hypothetical protein